MTYNDLRYQLIRWANVNPNEVEMHTLQSAFACIRNKDCKAQAAHRFFEDALYLLDKAAMEQKQ